MFNSLQKLCLLVAAGFALLIVALHAVVLSHGVAEQSALPIAQLSVLPGGNLHTLGLLGFGSGQLLLAWTLRGVDSGALWPVGRVLLALAGLSVLVLAFIFSTPDEAGRLYFPGDPLWVTGTFVGLAMGALQAGMRRRSLTLGRFNLLALALWIVLIPLAQLPDGLSIGVYERLVGSIYVLWVFGVCVGLWWAVSVPGALGEEHLHP